MKRKLPRLFFLLVVLVMIVYLVSWKSPAYYIPAKTNHYGQTDSIILFENYTGEHPRPMILSTPHMIIFGATHTMDPEDPQVKQIETAWKKLQPTIALVEGRLGLLFPVLMDPVKNYGESGKVNWLAHNEGIKVYDWDLSEEALAEQLQKQFTKEQVALQQVLNPYFSNLRFGRPSSPENFVKGYLKRAAFVNMQDSMSAVADVDRYWKKYFPAGPDWRNISDENELPGYLAHMMAVTNDLRNRQLVAAVKELLASGERVFVVCGSSHAYCVQPAFK